MATNNNTSYDFDSLDNLDENFNAIYPQEKITRPHVETSYNDDALRGQSTDSEKPIAIIGTAENGRPNTVYKLDSYLDAKNIFGNGDILTAVQLVWNANGKHRSAGGTIYAMRIEDATPAHLYASGLRFTARAWGEVSNNIALAFEQNDIDNSYKLTVDFPRYDYHQVYDGIGQLFRLQYQGNSKNAKATYSVNVNPKTGKAKEFILDIYDVPASATTTTLAPTTTTTTMQLNTTTTTTLFPSQTTEKGTTTENVGTTTTSKDGTTTTTTKTVVSLENVLFDTNEAEIKTGDELQLSWKVDPQEANQFDLTFTSSDESVATVNAKGHVVTLKEGIVDITVSAKDSDGKVVADTLKLTVSNNATADTAGDNTGKNFIAMPINLQYFAETTTTTTVKPATTSTTTTTVKPTTTTTTTTVKTTTTAKPMTTSTTTTTQKAETTTTTVKTTTTTVKDDKEATTTVRYEDGTTTTIVEDLENHTSTSTTVQETVDGTTTTTTTAKDNGDGTVTTTTQTETLRHLQQVYDLTLSDFSEIYLLMGQLAMIPNLTVFSNPETDNTNMLSEIMDEAKDVNIVYPKGSLVPKVTTTSNTTEPVDPNIVVAGTLAPEKDNDLFKEDETTTKVVPSTTIQEDHEDDEDLIGWVWGVRGDLVNRMQYDSYVKVEADYLEELTYPFGSTHMIDGYTQPTPISWAKKLDTLRGVEAYYIIPLTPNANVHQELRKYIEDRYNAGIFVRGIVGAGYQEPLGRLVARQNALRYERMSLVGTSGMFRMPDGTIQHLPAYMVAVLAGAIQSNLQIGGALTNKYINMVSVDQQFTSTELDTLNASGVILVEPILNRGTASGYRFVQDVTTYNSPKEKVKSRISLGEITDFLFDDLRQYLEKTWIGTNIKGATSDLIRTGVGTFLLKQKNDPTGYIVDYDENDIQVFLKGNKAWITFTVQPSQTLDLIKVFGAYQDFSSISTGSNSSGSGSAIVSSSENVLYGDSNIYGVPNSNNTDIMNSANPDINAGYK